MITSSKWNMIRMTARMVKMELLQLPGKYDSILMNMSTNFFTTLYSPSRSACPQTTQDEDLLLNVPS